MKAERTQTEYGRPMTNHAAGQTSVPETDDLAEFDAEYAARRADDAGFPPLPEGSYIVYVERADVTRAKSGRALLRWRLRCIEPDDYNGRLLWHNRVIASGHFLGKLKHDLELCGLKLEKLSDLPQQLPHVIDVVLEISVRHHHGFENITFRERLGGPEQLEAQAALPRPAE